MARSSNPEKAQRLNAAFDLLARGYTLADAAAALTQEFGLSRRQAYRYLQEAQGIDGPVSVSSPTVPITVKVPEAVVVKLRAYAQANGLTLGEIVARAVLSFLEKVRWHG
jgi:predicted DNA-binding transcriptional regulator YafY